MGQRPDDHKGSPDDERLLDRPEEATVLGVVAVVAHDEHLVVADLVGRVGTRSVPGLHVRLVEGATVDEHLAVAYLDGLARQADHPFDQVLDAVVLLPRGATEHHDVATVHVVELVAQLVDEHPITLLEGRDHRFRRDVESGEEEGPDDERHDEGAADDGDPFDDRTGRRALALGGPGGRRGAQVVALRRPGGVDLLGRAHTSTVPASPSIEAATAPAAAAVAKNPGSRSAPRPIVVTSRPAPPNRAAASGAPAGTSRGPGPVPP